MPRTKVIILGITGQVGSYLAEKSIEAGEEVHGIVRRSSQFNRNRIEPLIEREKDRLQLHYADLFDATALRRIFAEVQPDHVYHLAGQSHVGLSFEIPESTFHEVAAATLSLLEICRDLPRSPRIYLAGSSEVFGKPDEVPQSEQTPHRPTSPYGCAKSCCLQLGSVYRGAYGLFVSAGISYNSESVRRGPHFVTRKITATAARISAGADEVLELGNLNASRDWGYAPEYVEAMMAILNHETPDDYVIATGTLTSVREFAMAAFEEAGMDLQFEGSGEGETGSVGGRQVLRINPRFFRPVEPTSLVGDPRKIERELGWKATTSGSEVARMMVREELKLLDG